MDAESLFPDLWVTTITAETVRAGCTEFMGRARAAEEDGAVDFPDVEIVQQLTSEQLEQIPEDWLRGVRVKWTPDGSLRITRVETSQQSEAREEVFRQILKHAVSDWTMRPRRNLSIVLPDGSIVMPDVAVMRYERLNSSEPTTPTPVAVCEVDVSPRSVAHLARAAAAYLTRDSRIARVLWLQFFPPSIEELADQSQRLRIAALAIVFCQALTDQDRIEVVQMESFGNAPVALSFLKAFAEPSDDAPLFPYPSALRLATETSAHLPAYLEVATMPNALYNLPRAPQPLEVAMEAPLSSFAVDLNRVAVEALLGWHADRI